MQPAPIPKNETERLISLHKLGLLDTKPEERFDRITRTAIKVFDVPISTLTLVDEKREWFKSVCGLDQKEGDRAISFCGHALLVNEVFVIPDTVKDKRFSDNPMVIGKPYIRFYAGVPIMNADGQRVGVFCIKDTKPRSFSKDDEGVLQGLASWAEVEINYHNLSLALQKVKEQKAGLEVKTQELEKLSESREKLKLDYQALFNNMTDGLAYCQMIFDAQENPVDWMYIKVNENFEKLTGLKNAEGKKVSKLIPDIGASNPELFKIYGQVSLTGKPARFETYIAPLSRWFLVSVFSPQKNFFVALFQNINDRKQIEKNLEDAKIAAQNVYNDLLLEKGKLAEAKAKDEAILSSIGDGIIATDSDRKIILMNRVAEKLLGWNINEALGKSYDDIVLLEDEKGTFVPPKEKPLHKALESRTTTTTTTTTVLYLLSKNKIKFPVAITVSPIVLDNKIIGAVEVFRDITKEQQIDRAKSEFISLASHQLRTPMTAIRWVSEMLGKKERLTPGGKKYVADIIASTKHLSELVDLLLNVSRIDEGGIVITPKPLELVSFIREYLTECEPLFIAKHLHISFAKHPNTLTVVTDPSVVRNIIQVFVSNASEYTPPDGKIEVSLTEHANDRIFTLGVSDTGIGIPKAEQPNIFTKFMRASNAKLFKSDGTGLGTYIAWQSAKLLGGRIWFVSVENKGTTFFVELPMKSKMMKGAEGAVGTSLA
ncbi:MAG: Sensory box protein [Parcubacteria group bacterium GW2011_GWA2_49_9]|nr:MAG: Sensory box protein [Parcubacteria group bacterium GW2011_GWA2_49_9]